MEEQEIEKERKAQELVLDKRNLENQNKDILSFTSDPKNIDPIFLN